MLTNQLPNSLASQEAKIPANLASDCPELKDGTGTGAGNVERDWRRDRSQYRTCADLHHKSIEWVQNRDKRLSKIR